MSFSGQSLAFLPAVRAYLMEVIVSRSLGQSSQYEVHRTMPSYPLSASTPLLEAVFGRLR